MKKVLSPCALILLIIAAFVNNSPAQSVTVKFSEGELNVNGKIIEPDALPENLDLGEVNFGLELMIPFPMRVLINGEIYEIWEDRVIKGDQNSSAHYRISLDPEGKNIRIRALQGADLGGLVDVLSYQIRSAFDAESPEDRNSPGLTPKITVSPHVFDTESFGDMNAPESATMRTHPFGQQFIEYSTGFEYPDLMIPYDMTSLHGDVARMLEFSNYLFNVRDRSDELFELLQYEWHEEAQAIQMALEIHGIEIGQEREKAIEELKAKLEQIFSMKQENRRKEIQYLETELERLQEQLRERARAKDRLIDARMNQLLRRNQ